MRFLYTLAVLLLTPAHALGGQQVPQRDRVVIGGLAGIAMADATLWDCCALREPPDIVGLSDNTWPAEFGVDARYLWTRQTGTFVQWSRSTTSTQSVTYPPMVPAFPFTTYVAERRVSTRHHQWLFGQTLELSPANRVKTWVFGAFGIRMIEEHQESTSLSFNDPAVRSFNDEAWRRRQLQLIGGVGVRVDAAPGMFVGGELGMGIAFSEGCTNCHDRIRVHSGDGKTIILRALAGVRF